jgi:hypothetical protein
MQDNLDSASVVEFQPPKKRRTGLIIGGIVALVVVLAAAAFVAGRLMNAQAQPQAAGGNFVVSSRGGPGGPVTKRFSIQSAPELPASQPDIAGVFVRREDKSIFVGTGNVRTMVKASSPGAKPEMSSDYDGPVMEIVVTHDTQVYQDMTEMSFDKMPESGKLQQVVKPGSLDDIGANSMVQAWGEKQGDRLVARVLAFRSG